MKKHRIYFRIYALFFVLCSNILFTKFDFHQEYLDTKEQIKTERQEFAKRFQQLKKQLLESFKVHQDDPKLDEEEIENEHPEIPNHNQEQQENEDKQHYFDIEQNKPFVLITLKSNDNLPRQFKFAIEATIVGAGKAIIGWIFGGGALTAAEIAAIEAAKLAATAATAAAAKFVADSAAKNQINKNTDSSSNDNANNGKDNKSLQEQKALEVKRHNELQENVKKTYQISALEKTDPVQAAKLTQELRAWIDKGIEEEKKQKFMDTFFPQSMPNRQQALIDAGLAQPTGPGYTLIDNSVNAKRTPYYYSPLPAHTTTEAKTPPVATQQPTVSPAITTEKSTVQPPVPVATPTTKPIPAPAQITSEQKVSTPALVSTQKETTFLPNHTAATDFFGLHPNIPMPIFIPGQTNNTSQNPAKTEATYDKSITNQDDNVQNALLKKKHETESIIKQHLKNNASSGSPTPPPDNDPDDEKKKQEKFKSENPNGIYEENPKHHKNSPGNIGKPPINGQKALNESIEVPGKDYKLAVENGELIKFQEHSPGKYHGYKVDPSQKIIQLDKNTLKESGLEKQLNKGNPYR